MDEKHYSAQAAASDPADGVREESASSHFLPFDLFEEHELIEAFGHLPQEVRPIFAYMHNGMLEVLDVLLQGRDPVEVLQRELDEPSDVNGLQIVECRKIRDFLKEDAAAFEARRGGVDMRVQRDILDNAIIGLNHTIHTASLVSALDALCRALDKLGLSGEARQEWHARLEQFGLDESAIVRLIAIREDGALWNDLEDLLAREQEPPAGLMEMLREHFEKNLEVDSVVITAEEILSTARTLSKNGRQRFAFIHNELLQAGLKRAQGNVNDWIAALRTNMDDAPAARKAVTGQILESIKASDALRKELKNFDPASLPEELDEAVRPLAKAFAKHGDQYPVYIVLAHLVRACCRAQGKDDCELLNVLVRAVGEGTPAFSAGIMVTQLFNLVTDEQLKRLALSYEAYRREHEDEYGEDEEDDYEEESCFDDADALLSDVRSSLAEMDFYRASFIVQATFHAAHELLMDKQLSKTFVKTVDLESGEERMLRLEMEPAGEFFLGMPQARIPEARFQDLFERKDGMSEEEAIGRWLRSIEGLDAALENIDREDARLLQGALYYLGILAHYMLELSPKQQKRLSKLIEAPFESQAFLFSVAAWFADESEYARREHAKYAGESAED